MYVGKGKSKKLVGYMKFKPKFSTVQHEANGPIVDFSKHENYYKLLEDFKLYDSVTCQASRQNAVELNPPSKENALTGDELEAYKQRFRDTGFFSEKEIEKYAKKAQMYFKELVVEEIKGRADYENSQAPNSLVMYHGSNNTFTTFRQGTAQ